MQFWEGERNERFYKLAAQFSNGRPARNYSDPINGGLCVPVGRHIEIRLSESRRWTIYEARISSAVFHCDRRRLVRDHRRLVAAYRVFDTADRGAVYDRDACGDGVDEDPSIPGNIAVAAATRTTANRFVGGVARDPIRVRATLQLCVPAGGRTWGVVSRCVARATPYLGTGTSIFIATGTFHAIASRAQC